MKQSHYLIACACVVSLGIGYVAGGMRASSANKEQPQGEASSPDRINSSSRQRPSRESSGDELLDGILKGRPAQDLSDDELVKIVLQLSKRDATQSPVSAARKAYQLQLLLGKLPASRLEQAAQALADDPDSERGGPLNTILGAMASKDPHRALAWAKTQKNASGLMSYALSAMAKDDPMAAADLYREGLLDGTFNHYSGSQASYGIAYAMARLGKRELLNFMDSLPQGQQGNMLANCFRELPEGDRMEMLDEIYQRSKDGRAQDWNLKYSFTNALQIDRAQAEAWLDQMQAGKERANLELYAASHLSSNGDPDAARGWMARAIAQSQGREKELLNQAISQLGYNSPGDLATFASLLPVGIEIKAEDLKNQARNNNYRGFGGLTGLAEAIRDPSERMKLITTALGDYKSNIESRSHSSRLNDVDFEILARQLQTLNLTGENATKVAEALDAARNAIQKPKE